MSWPVETIGDYFEVKHGFAFSGKLFAESGKYIVVTPGSFFEAGGFRRRSPEKFYASEPPAEFVLSAGDLIVAMTEQSPGLLGSTAWVPEGGRYLHNQRIGLFVDVNERRLNPGFLYHLMNSAIVRQQIQATATGTKVKHTAPKRIGAVRVSLPPLDVQRRIADILSAYDQLIENNDRRMDLLEASIHLLYREWFVYLRLPGHERMEIVDGVPSGWRRATVGSVLARAPTRRKVPKNEYQQSGTIPTVDQSRDFIGGYTDDISALYTAEHLPLVVFGDHTRILKFVDFPFARGADGTQVLSPAPGAITPHFLYFALSAVDLSGFGHARHFKHLKAEEILVPTPPTVVAFDEIAQPALKQVSILREQNQQLREARDLLLPRLMDGRIRV